jgi:hypothetical protein
VADGAVSAQSGTGPKRRSSPWTRTSHL